MVSKSARICRGALSKWDHLLVDHDDPEKRISDLERQLVPQSAVPGEPGFGRPARLRQRWQLARHMVKVTDPDGVRWKVYRCWFPRRGIWFLNGDWGEATGIVLAVVWLPWFIAKWLGVPWIIQVERSGGGVGDERVRGWRESQRRIHKIAESAAAGTLNQELAGIRRRGNQNDV